MVTIFATGNIPDFSGWEKPADVFTAEENLRFTTVYGTGHDETEWLTALYDAAQLFFR